MEREEWRKGGIPRAGYKARKKVHSLSYRLNGSHPSLLVEPPPPFTIPPNESLQQVLKLNCLKAPGDNRTHYYVYISPDPLQEYQVQSAVVK